MNSGGDENTQQKEGVKEQKEEVKEQKEVAVKERMVSVTLQSAGDAPILKKKKWQVRASQTMAWVMNFLRAATKIKESESLFVYINQSFSPTLDRDIGGLFDCFNTNGTLILHYAKTPAWG